MPQPIMFIEILFQLFSMRLSKVYFRVPCQILLLVRTLYLRV